MLDQCHEQSLKLLRYFELEKNMTANDKSGLDASAYWQQRVVSGSDLAVVGHRSMGADYNGGFYTQFWQSRGVSDYVGLDIPAQTISVVKLIEPLIDSVLNEFRSS